MSNSYFSICSFFYILLLTFVYFSKKRSKNKIQSVYGGLIITNLLGLIIAVACFFTVQNYEQNPITNYIISRLYLVYLIVWISLFTMYTYLISFKGKNSNKIKWFLLACSVICSILAYTLPLEYVSEKGMVYSQGPAANLVYFYSELCIVLCLIFMFMNSKNIKGTRYAPLFIFIAGGALVMVIQAMYPQLLLITSTEALVTFLIYFTIEDKEAVQKLEKKEK